MYDGFEKAAKEGVEAFTKIGVPKEIAVALAEVAKERIRLPYVKVKGIVELRCMKPNGVNLIKEAFLKAEKSEKPKDVAIRFYVVSAPKYCVEVSAENYKIAEKVLHNIAENVVSNIKKAGGEGNFRRVR